MDLLRYLDVEQAIASAETAGKQWSDEIVEMVRILYNAGQWLPNSWKEHFEKALADASAVKSEEGGGQDQVRAHPGGWGLRVATCIRRQRLTMRPVLLLGVSSQ